MINIKSLWSIDCISISKAATTFNINLNWSAQASDSGQNAIQLECRRNEENAVQLDGKL